MFTLRLSRKKNRTFFNKIPGQKMTGRLESKSKNLVLKATSVMSGVILALCVDALLSINFQVIDWASMMVRLGLLIITVWVAQLLSSWEQIYNNQDAAKFPLGGVLHLWTYVVYIILTFLACKNNDNYYLALIFISLIAILDLIDSFIGWRFTHNYAIKEVSRNWVIRDLTLFPLGLIFAWVLYLKYDIPFAKVPSLNNAVLFAFGMLVNYLFDLWINRKFYGTKSFFRFILQGPSKIIKRR